MGEQPAKPVIAHPPRPVVHLEFPGVGRITRTLWGTTPAQVAKAEGILLYLFDRGDLKRLAKIRDGRGMLADYDLLEGFDLDQLVDSTSYAPSPSSFDRVYFALRRDANQLKIGMSGDVRQRIPFPQ